MKIGEIKKYGLFNSEKDYANLKYSPQRTVSFFEFDYILSCQKNATSYIDGNAYKIAPNTLILRKPNQKAHSRLHFKCYCLHLEIPRSAPLFEELFSMPQFFTFLHEERYQTLFETLFQHLLKNDDCENDYFTSAKILELVYFLKRDEKHNKSIKTPLLKKETRSIQQIISYVKENYHEHLCLRKFGEITGYSPNHLQRIFTLVLGISPQKYLEKVRIDQAKYLLSKKELSLADIAYVCGFSSQSYFSKIFKKYTLLSPYEFRQKSAFKYDDERKE